MKRMMITTAAIVCTLAASVANAQQWGDLSITFTYDGAVPVPAAINADKDTSICGVKEKLFDETVVVNSANKGIANVVVYLFLATGDAKPAVHPDYAKTAQDKVVLDNSACRFVPHICLLRTSQTLLLSNSDPIGHNTKVDVLNNTPINPIIPASAKLEHKDFKVEERLPSNVSCSIHPWMTAKLLIKEHPYMAISDKDGKVTIKNLPAGTHKFQVWHEKPGFVQAKDWSKGRFTQAIKAGANDLGEIKIKL